MLNCALKRLLTMSKRKVKIMFRKNEFIDEDMEWLSLTPSQRLYQTSRLWQFYIALGGRLDPEPNPQSPFYFQET